MDVVERTFTPANFVRFMSDTSRVDQQQNCCAYQLHPMHNPASAPLSLLFLHIDFLIYVGHYSKPNGNKAWSLALQLL